MATRKPKATVTQLPEDVVASFSAETVIEADAQVADSDKTWRESVQAALDMEFGGEVSVSRYIAASVAALAISLGVSYSVGKILGATLVGSVVLGHSAFTQVAIFILGLVIAWYVAGQAAQYVSSRILNKTYDRMWDMSCVTAQHAGATMRGWFSATPTPAY